MIQNTYSKKINGISKTKLWSVWTNINEWNKWQDDLEYAQSLTSFKKGGSFILKPKGGPKVNIKLLDVIENESFTDLTQFPLAKMYGRHDFIEHSDGIEIKTTMSIEGPLAFLWKRLVYNGIVSKLESQTDALIAQTLKNDKI